MAKSVEEKTHVKYSDLHEDCEDEYVRIVRYLDLDRKDFCCYEIYKELLGEDDGRCELNFNYNPVVREYSIDIRPEYGGAICLVKYCPWCGKKFPKGLRDEWFNILKKEHNIEPELLKWRERKDIPEEFKSDEWWKKRKL